LGGEMPHFAHFLIFVVAYCCNTKGQMPKWSYAQFPSSCCP
jgi:hypothetical protein